MTFLTFTKDHTIININSDHIIAIYVNLGEAPYLNIIHTKGYIQLDYKDFEFMIEKNINPALMCNALSNYLIHNLKFQNLVINKNTLNQAIIDL